MTMEEHIKQKLIERGFSEKTIINNRGLIGAVIDEMLLHNNIHRENTGRPYDPPYYNDNLLIA